MKIKKRGMALGKRAWRAAIVKVARGNTSMRARTSSNFGLIGPPTAELAALESLKNSP